ncbi:MAG TPA: hypothetical protein VFM88_17870 [Vicinamibacteria bacterium]|nr:hypothetical protein [Vicinamibacteria bacterium]
MTGHAGGGMGYETKDVRASAILKFTVYLFLVTILVLFLMRLLYVGFARLEARRQPPPPIMRTSPERQAPLPRLQVSPTRDVNDLRRNEEAVLSSYAWVDEPSGIARIPIEEAMQIALRKGYPVRGSGEAPAPSPAAARGGKAK